MFYKQEYLQKPNSGLRKNETVFKKGQFVA